MNAYPFSLAGATLALLPSGALHWPTEGLLVVSDMHLGKSERIARRSGTLLPPYETRDTLARLDADIQATAARTVLCLGDSFDDAAAADALAEEDLAWLTRLMAGRRWLWIEGNPALSPSGAPIWPSSASAHWSFVTSPSRQNGARSPAITTRRRRSRCEAPPSPAAAFCSTRRARSCLPTAAIPAGCPAPTRYSPASWRRTRGRSCWARRLAPCPCFR